MRKLKMKTRFWVLFLAMGCAAVTATNLPLFAHLASAHHAHAEEHPDHDADDPSPQSHHSEHCSTCQLLLGPGGKCILLTTDAVVSITTPVPFTCNVDSQLHYQHKTLPFSVRGPPVF
jgi:hypothetical protein